MLNANYVRARLKRSTASPTMPRPCTRSGATTEKYKEHHVVRAFDISKRLIDYGFHPPRTTSP